LCKYPHEAVLRAVLRFGNMEELEMRMLTRTSPLHAAPAPDSAKRGDHLRGEQLKMRLNPPRRQSGGECPGIVVCDRDLADVVADHRDRRLGLDDFEQAALSQVLAIAQIHGIGHQAGLR